MWERGHKGESFTTLFSLMKQRNGQSLGPAGQCADVEATIEFLHTQHEENYKVIIAPVVAYHLTHLVSINDKFEETPTPFNAQQPPDISVNDYLARIIKYTPCSAECYILALIFIDRIIEKKRIRVDSLNVHRFLLLSVMISSKILDDTTYNNRYYSHVGGLNIKELNMLECELLVLLEYNLNVTPKSFACYEREVELHIATVMQQDPEKVNSPTFACEKADDLKQHRLKLNEARENANFLAKTLRRSRSFTGASPDGKLFNRRKKRSTSFNITSVAT